MSHSTLEIKEYLESQGVDVSTYDYRAIKFGIVDGVETLYYQNKPLDKLPKVVFARGNCYKLMKYLSDKGVAVINGFMNMVHMKDKWQTYLDLKEINIPQPKTINSNKVLDYGAVVEEIGVPFIVKYRFGAQGKSVYLVNSKEEYYNIISSYNFDDLILQEYISTSYGKDIRVFVVGDKYFGAIRDNSKNGFRANLAQGGEAYSYQIDNDLLGMIRLICDKLCAEVVGLDFLFSSNGLVFCEANGNAGYKSFTSQGIDMSKHIADYIYEKYFEVR